MVLAEALVTRWRRLRARHRVAVVYMALVCVLDLLTFGLGTSLNLETFIPLVAITAPMGLVGWFSMWAMIHSTYHYVEMLVPLGGAALNVYRLEPSP